MSGRQYRRVVVRTLAFLVLHQILGLVGGGQAVDAEDVKIAVLRHQLAVLPGRSSGLARDPWPIFLVTVSTLARRHHELIRRRWSPRAFADRPVDPATIRSLFEAARWAPSAGNGQPWSFIVADRFRDPAGFARMLDLLNPKNQDWARHAPLLIIGVTQRIRDEGKEARHAVYDLGMAVENLVLQAVDLGLVVHQMAGFDHERAREVYAIPPAHEAIVAIAVGYQGHHGGLPDDLQLREVAPRQRKPVSSFVYGGRFGESADLGGV
jgi:nitroreductase